MGEGVTEDLNTINREESNGRAGQTCRELGCSAGWRLRLRAGALRQLDAGPWRGRPGWRASQLHGLRHGRRGRAGRLARTWDGCATWALGGCRAEQGASGLRVGSWRGRSAGRGCWRAAAARVQGRVRREQGREERREKEKKRGRESLAAAGNRRGGRRLQVGPARE